MNANCCPCCSSFNTEYEPDTTLEEVILRDTVGRMDLMMPRMRCHSCYSEWTAIFKPVAFIDVKPSKNTEENEQD